MYPVFPQMELLNMAYSYGWGNLGTFPDCESEKKCGEGEGRREEKYGGSLPFTLSLEMKFIGI